MKYTKAFIFLSFLFWLNPLHAQQVDCYPVNWWVHMKNPKLQIMLHGKDLANGNHYTINYAGVKIEKIHKVQNSNYVFLDLLISPSCKPGVFFIYISGKKNYEIKYSLKARRKGNGTQYAQGIYSSDLIYLIMPDRFSNGDTSNDRIVGMRDQSLNRDSVYARHGGDLMGIQNHLDYFTSLGVNTLWLNPVIVNDMPNRTEHGYAFTNHYKIDPRIGEEVGYHQLIDAAHAKKMKIIQDAVYNHVGLYHLSVLDLPMKDWLNQWPHFTKSNYKDQVLFDPYASAEEKKVMSDGWFVTSMPDLNQRNPYVANFLIQHAIWTVEEFGIDGWRIDTYAYNDLNFMNNCNNALVTEFPKLTMFGETWVHGAVNQAYFVENNFSIPYKSNLQGVTDFQCLWGITDAMTKKFGWDEGVNVLYTTLAKDFIYKDPMRNVIFLDNHDLSRFYSVAGENMLKYRGALAWLYTSRGIPQIYYGDEIGLKGFTTPNDGHVRQDFPGGWKNDKENKFLQSGRDSREDSIWNYVAALGNFRKNSSAIKVGKMMQYTPKEGEYVFFRYDKTQTIMTALNTVDTTLKISMHHYDERTKGFTKMKNVITGEVSAIADFMLKPYESGVWELL